jgi:hypothetical protein
MQPSTLFLYESIWNLLNMDFYCGWENIPPSLEKDLFLTT